MLEYLYNQSSAMWNVDDGGVGIFINNEHFGSFSVVVIDVLNWFPWIAFTCINNKLIWLLWLLSWFQNIISLQGI